jgi:DNA-binding LacI/PurR family transcriptional regulator
MLQDENVVISHPGSGTIVSRDFSWKKLAVLFPEMVFGHWETIYKEISYFMKAKGWTLDLFEHHGRLELMQEHLNKISNGDYAGVIMALPMALIQKDETAIQSLIESGFPLVFIGSNLNAWSVDDNLYSCGYWGTKHLIDQKYKRLAFVGCRSYDGEEFIKGCREALDEAGLDDVGTGYAEDEDFAIKILNNWLNLDKGPDALFYQRSDHGQKCFHILQAKNIQIGFEMGFMALDDTMFHRFTAPGPSAVRRYPDRIGRKAVDLFLELVNLSKKERLARLDNPKQVDAEFAMSPGRSTCGKRMGGRIYRVPNPYRAPTVDDFYPPCPPMPPGFYDGYSA